MKDYDRWKLRSDRDEYPDEEFVIDPDDDPSEPVPEHEIEDVVANTHRSLRLRHLDSKKVLIPLSGCAVSDAHNLNRFPKMGF